MGSRNIPLLIDFRKLSISLIKLNSMVDKNQNVIGEEEAEVIQVEQTFKLEY